MKVNVIKINEVTKVECVHTDIEKNLFRFAIKDHLCIIGFEDEIDDDTLDKIKDIVCDAGMVELPDVCDRIIAFNPNGFFSCV